MAKRTVTKTLSDGTIVSTTSGCFGRSIAIFFGISLLIWAIVSPAENYPWYEALLTYLGMALVVGFIVRAVRHQQKLKAQQPLKERSDVGNQANVPDSQRKPASVEHPRTAAVAEARFQLSNYSGGLPSYPQPETKGTLIFPGSGPTFGRWELHWATGSDLDTQHHLVYGGLAHYPLTVEATGPASCRATISDALDPAIFGHFDLPSAAPAAVKEALLARATVVEAARRSLGIAFSEKSPSSRLGIADELAKLADLHAKGVLSDEEFVSQKAKLLSQ